VAANADANANAMNDFIRALLDSLDGDTFVSFVLDGTPSPKKIARTMGGKKRTTIERKTNRETNYNALNPYNDGIAGDGGNVEDIDPVAAIRESIRGRYKSVTGRLILMKDRSRGRDGGSRGRDKGRRRKFADADDNEADDDSSPGVDVGVGRSLYLQATIKYHLATDVVKNWKVGGGGNGGRRRAGGEGGEEYGRNAVESEVEDGIRRIFASAMGWNEDDDEPSSLLSEWGRRRPPSSSSIVGDADTTMSKYDDAGIRSGELVTTDGSYELRLSPTSRRGGSSFFRRRHPPASKNANASPSLDDGKMNGEAVPPMDGTQNGGVDGRHSSSDRYSSHDRSKNVPLSPSSAFLRLLGVTNANGKPMAGMSSKLRQCQKFVEIVGNLVDDCTISSETHDKIRVIDMGCGRGYLTFSLHSYLCDKFGGGGITTMEGGGGGNGGCGVISVETRGIDRRPKLIEEINGIAAKLGGDFASLAFDEGTIGNAAARDDDRFENNDDDRRLNSSWDGNCKSTLDVVIALHACDTATDDALHFALRRSADVIVVAPCCQHELRSQIDRRVVTLPTSSSSTQQRHALADILRHAVYRERATETVTDAMRATLLEIAGYDVRVFEFVGSEHTAKNVMIAATKSSRERGPEYVRDRRDSLACLARFYGIERQRLAVLMGESVMGGQDNVPMKKGDRNLSGMPPL
jgi:hypothetical protein